MERINRPFVSVIIPVKNDAARLALCLSALARQSYPSDRFEVLVCDSASSDHPESSLADCAQARIVPCDARAGRAAARNQGLERAQGEVLAFTDADCIPDCGWLEEGVAMIASSSQRTVVGGRILISVRDSAYPSAMETYDSIVNFRQQHYINVYRFCATANMFVGRSTMSAVGPFDDEHFDGYGGEDRDWGLRAHEAGYSFEYAASATVAHPAQRSIMTFLRKYAMITESSRLIRQKHGVTGPKRSFIRRVLNPESRLRLLLSHSQDVSMMRFLQLLGLHALECAVHAYVSVKCAARKLRSAAA